MGVDHVGLLADTWAERWPERIALIAGDMRWTYVAFAGAVQSMAGTLHAAGVRRGERVPLVDVGGPLAFSAVLGAARLGASAAPMNPRLTGDELRQLADIAGATKVAVAGDDFRPIVDGNVIGSEALAGSADHLESTPGDEGVVLFTSGTTGLPKPVPVPSQTLLARLAAYTPAADLQVRLMCVPIHHVGGLIGGQVSLTSGHTLVVQPRFDAGEWLRLVEKHRVALTFVVPTMLARILDHPDYPTADLSSLQVVTYGASPMPDALIARATEALPHVGFVNTFGQTETLGGITLSLPEDARHPVHRTSVGKLVPGTQVRVVDPENGSEVAPGEVGELHVLSSQNVVADWIRTGDLVRIDGDGYVYPAGRLSDTINRGGEKFGPVEVETVLRQHPAVRDVVVVGVPDAELNERVGAVVVVSGETTVEQLQQFCTGQLARYKTPEHVAFVDAVPLTDIGKVDRRAIIRMLLDGKG